MKNSFTFDNNDGSNKNAYIIGPLLKENNISDVYLKVGKTAMDVKCFPTTSKARINIYNEITFLLDFLSIKIDKPAKNPIK